MKKTFIHLKILIFCFANFSIFPNNFLGVMVAKAEETAAHYYCEGVKNSDKGDYDPAIQSFTKSINLDSGQARAYAYRAWVYERKKNFDLAINDYTKAIEQNPWYSYAYNGRGLCLYKKNQFDSAIRDFSKAIELDPKYAEAYHNRGDAYKKKGKLLKAFIDFQKAADYNPESAKYKGSADPRRMAIILGSGAVLFFVITILMYLLKYFRVGERRPNKEAVIVVHSQPGPWGFWATMGWLAAIFIMSVLSGITGTILFMVNKSLINKQKFNFSEIHGLAANGDFISLTTVFQAVFCGAIVLLAIKLRKNYSFTEYLALKKVDLPKYIFWFAVTVFYLLLAELCQYLFPIPVSDWMVKTFESASHIVPFVIAIAIVVPIFEELVFRGFVFKGLQAKLGSSGAILITTIVWAMTHIQYESLLYLIPISILGIILGVSRWKTGSVYVPIVIHILNNSVSVVLMYSYLAK